MLLDAQLQFSANQALTATGVSTNTLDITKARRIFAGAPFLILVFAIVGADFTTGDETYQIQLQTAVDTAFTSPVTLDTKTVTAAQLALGVRVLMGSSTLIDTNVLQYLRLNYVLGGTTPSVTLTAYLLPREFLDMYTTYPDAITIS